MVYSKFLPQRFWIVRQGCLLACRLSTYISQKYPDVVNSLEEASRLFNEASYEEKHCRLSREATLDNVRKAQEEADLADRKLHDAEIHCGQIMYIIRRSGFILPAAVPVPPRLLVCVNGGESFFSLTTNIILTCISTATHTIAIPGSDATVQIILD